METAQENRWLIALQDGDGQAFRKLFDDYFYPLFSFAFKYVENEGEAEDVVSEVIYELWEKKLHFESILMLKSFLYRSVRNRCLNILKHREIEEKYREQNDWKSESDFFLDQILEEEVYLELRKTIESLPESIRKIYELVLLGYDNQEISVMTGLSSDAIKARKKRGKQLLQEKLKHLVYLLVLFQ